MKVPVSWLQQYFDAPLDAHRIADRLTLAGIEVEHVQGVGALDPLVLVAQVTQVTPLAGGAFKLGVVADRARTVVTNAPGLTAGARIAVALPGATLFSEALDSLVEVGESEVYGVASEGMLAHRAALGIGDDASRAVTFGDDVPAGTPVAKALAERDLGHADRVLSLAILPNIARCQSMRGVAREVAALSRLELRPQREPAPFSAEGSLNPSIEAPDAASVLGLTLLENVRVGESPRYVKERLLLGGMTPINNVVDASNYVMLELGQPTHPYDAELLSSLDLGVRRARAGDRLLTLQQAEGEEPMPLPEGVPLIVSDDAPVAVAGVLGGRPTSISESTRRVLLEAAAFDYVAIRRSQQIAKVYSEASARFSRGVNPELPQLATRRFIEVLRETSPDLRIVAHGEASLGVPAPRRIELSLRELNDSLGADIDLETAAECLRRVALDLAVNRDAEAFTVTVGNARPDLTAPCDLVEEVARLIGFDRIPETLPVEPIPERLHEDAQTRREAVRDLLVRNALQETIAYSLNGPELEAKLYRGHPAATPASAVAVLNPVSVDRSVLRTSLLPALLAATSNNLRHFPQCRLFEIGPVFAPRGDVRELPVESERVAFVIGGLASAPSLHEPKPRALDFFDAKALLLEIFDGLRLLDGFEWVPHDEPPYRPGAAARLMRGERSYGTVGAVHPLVLRAFDMEDHSVFAADLSLEALLADSPKRPAFREYDRLPSIELDIALFVAVAMPAVRIRQTAKNAAGSLLREVEVFDQFFNPELPEQKSIAIRLRLNAGERTLEMSEALAVRERVARALESELSAKIRE
ncbi:MAG: phenylalanine--tRNA ligase subunit beta [Myxococcota bacterium]